MRKQQGMFTAPIWASAFRPFYLAGAAYGVLVLLAWLAAMTGGGSGAPGGLALRTWHGHELVFGHAVAIVCGILLTALPSWIGARETRGGRLASLIALWLAGRIAVWLSPWLPAWVVALADGSLPVALVVLVTPALLAARERYYLALLPALLGLAGANVLFHAARILSAPEGMDYGVRAGVYAIVLLYVLKGGFLTPVFTGNRLRETGRGTVTFSLPLEWAAVLAALWFAATGLAQTPPVWNAAAAFVAAAVHALRLARWQGWKVLDAPLLWPMHLGYAFLVLAFALRGLEQFAVVPAGAWLHAFTVGSLGPMMMALMARVSLRHTGRALVLPPLARLALALIVVAAAARLAFGLGVPVPRLLVLAALCWALAFAICLWVFGPLLVRPSLPRVQRRD